MRDVLETDWLIEEGRVGMAVPTGFAVLMMLALIAIMMVIIDNRRGGVIRVAAAGKIGFYGVVMTKFFNKMCAITQRIGGKQEKKEENCADIFFVG
ncbi:MAG: hypothetical protein FD174_4140 [Geobacteraceae bacterium]|nr:MAG: hypothetical protein FD174_4140 [Geobacteraceae bacterium]